MYRPAGSASSGGLPTVDGGPVPGSGGRSHGQDWQRGEGEVPVEERSCVWHFFSLLLVLLLLMLWLLLLLLFLLLLLIHHLS